MSQYLRRGSSQPSSQSRLSQQTAARSQRAKQTLSLEQQLEAEVRAADEEAKREEEQEQQQEQLAGNNVYELMQKEKKLLKECMERLRIGDNGRVVGRQEELLTLTEFVRNAKKKCLTGDVGGAMYVSGAPGVGKTQSVKQVLEKERDVVFLNCMDCSEKATLSNVLSTIARELREAAEKQILSDSADEEDEEEIKRTPAGKSKSKPKGKAKAAAMKSAVGKAPAAKKFVLPKTSSPSPPDDEDDDAHLQVQDDKAQPMKRKRIVTPGPPQKRGRASFATPANKGAAASSSAARPGARSSVARSTGGSVNKQTIPGKFAELQDIVESLQRPLILVLDEVDFFTNSLASGAARKSIRGCTAAKTKKTVKPDDPFPRLFQLPRRGKLVLVGIANSVGLIQSQMSVLNTLEDVEQLVFRPYAPEEMKAIMWL